MITFTFLWLGGQGKRYTRASSVAMLLDAALWNRNSTFFMASKGTKESQKMNEWNDMFIRYPEDSTLSLPILPFEVVGVAIVLTLTLFIHCNS